MPSEKATVKPSVKVTEKNGKEKGAGKREKGKENGKEKDKTKDKEKAKENAKEKGKEKEKNKGKEKGNEKGKEKGKGKNEGKEKGNEKGNAKSATNGGPTPRAQAAEAHDGSPGDKEAMVFDWIDPEGRDLGKHVMVKTQDVVLKHGVPSQHIIKYLKSEIAEAEACLSLPFTLMLVSSYAIMAIAHDNAVNVRGIEDSLKADIEDNANFAFTGPMGHKGIYDVHSYADFWDWMRIGLLPLIFIQSRAFNEIADLESPAYVAAAEDYDEEERGFWLRYNRIAGGIRMAQERTLGNVSCSSQQEILTLYGVPCVTGLDYSIDPELGLPADLALRMSKPDRTQWLYVFEDLADMQAKIDEMESSGWLDRETLKVEISIPVYSAELGVHTLTRVNFYFARGGAIWKKIVPESQFANWHDRWYYSLYDGLWISCLAYIFVMELFEIQRLVRSKGVFAIFTSYMNFWNVIDWLSVLGGFAIIGTFLGSIPMLSILNSTLSALGHLNPLETRDQYISVTHSYLEELEANCAHVRTLRRTLAFYPLIIVLRLFKSFDAQPKLALVTKTMFRAAPDLFHFFIVFCSVFLTFVFMAITLFGREIRSFTTVPRAIMSCFRIMLGDMDWKELSSIGRLPAVVWLWLYICIVVLLLMNMILAIVMDHYEQEKAESTGETLLEEGLQVLQRWNGMRMGTFMPLSDLLDALEKEEEELRKRGQAKLGKTLGGLLKIGSKEKQEEEDHYDDHDGHDDKVHHETAERIYTVQSICRTIQKHNGRLLEEQAMDLLCAVVEEYYEENKTGTQLEEVMQLTRQVNDRNKKLIKITRSAFDKQDRGPIIRLQEFRKNLDSYLEKVYTEREEHVKELTRLKVEKLELERKIRTELKQREEEAQAEAAKCPQPPPSAQDVEVQYE